MKNIIFQYYYYSVIGQQRKNYQKPADVWCRTVLHTQLYFLCFTSTYKFYIGETEI